MTSHESPADRAYVAAMLEIQQQKFDRASADLQTQLDAYVNDCTSRYSEQIQAHQARVRQLEEDQRRWLARFIDGDADHDGAQDPQGQVGASTAGRNAPASSGPGPGQPNRNPADLELAQEIKNMSMAAYARERQRLIRANRGLFSQEPTS